MTSGVRRADVPSLHEPYTGFDWDTYLAFWDLTKRLTDDGVGIGIGIISHFITEQERFDENYELADGTLTWEVSGDGGDA